MKLCIIKPDGSSTEVHLVENQPSLENVNDEILLFENYYYKLIIKYDEVFDDIEMYIGDYAVDLVYNANTDSYETQKGSLFNGCFDVACVSIVLNNGYENENIYYSEYLRIATTKQTNRQIEQMLGEIENNLPNFLEVCFSRSRKKSGLIKNETRSMWNTLKIVDEIISIYEESYGYFINHKKTIIEQEAAIVDVNSMRKIDQESLIWIASNPDNLIETENMSIIKYKEKYYTPTKLKTYISKYSCDTYENRMILSFLKSIIEYINNQVVGLKRELLGLQNIPNSIMRQLPNTHDLTVRCVYIYYKGVIDRFEKKNDILQELFHRYMNVFQCVTDNVNGLPKLTNTFKRVYHYRICYECMVKWFEAGDYSFEHLNYLFKLKTLSRIFEYYCLIKLQIAIVNNGYVLIEASRVTYGLEDDLEDINNKYIFQGHGYELTLLYEPSIWVKQMNEEINLYSTGYNFLKSRWNDRWTPDFVLKIKTDSNEYYYILDAKYSNFQNVKKIYMPDLVLKYGTQISSKNKFYSDVVGVGAIYPNDSDYMYYFKKNSINSDKQSLPSYFSISIVSDKEGDDALSKRVETLLNVIDILDTEVVSTIDEADKMPNLSGYLNIKLDMKQSITEKTSELDKYSLNIENKNSTYDAKRVYHSAKGRYLRKKR